MLISFTVTAKLICVFVFAYAKRWFSHDAAHFCLHLIVHYFVVKPLYSNFRGIVTNFENVRNLGSSWYMYLSQSDLGLHYLSVWKFWNLTSLTTTTTHTTIISVSEILTMCVTSRSWFTHIPDYSLVYLFIQIKWCCLFQCFNGRGKFCMCCNNFFNLLPFLDKRDGLQVFTLLDPYNK